MQQLTLSTFGDPRIVIEYREHDPAEPNETELLVKMEAAPINDSDLLLARGIYGVRPALPATIGAEGVGRVVAAGSATPQGLVGKRVLILPTYEQGTWAEYVTVAQKNTLVVDGDADPLQLAMAPINGATAWLLLHRFAELGPGDWVGQNASNSAVGLYVVAIAKLLGARTLNVVRREEAAATVRQAGGDAVLVDGADLAERIAKALDGERLALTLDCVGGETAATMAHALRFGGNSVSYATVTGTPPVASVFDMVFKHISFSGFWVINWLRSAPREEVLNTYDRVVHLVNSGTLVAPVDTTYTLRDHEKAIAHAMAPRRGGKILFTFGE